MTSLFNIEVLRRRLRAAMDMRGIPPTTLSLRVGKSPTLVAELLEKNSDTKLSTIFKLAQALEVPVSHLLQDEFEPLPMGPTLYLKGEVAAGQWAEAFEWPMDDWRELSGDADIGYSAEHRFFLRVKGDSMDMLYPHGSLIECVSIFAGIEAKPGQRVVVLRKRHDQMVEATVKELVSMGGSLWLAPRSHNPAHQAFKIDEPGEDIEEVQIVAVVISSIRREP